MLDIVTLERRWLRYKLKRYFPILLIIVSILLLLFILYFFISQTTVGEVNAISKPTLQSIKKNQPDTDTMQLEPSMQFIQSLPLETQNSNNTHVQSIVQKPLQPVIQKQPIVPVIKSQIQPVIPPPAPLLQEKSTNVIGIKRDSNEFNIAEIETRFKSNSNPHLGLYIARYHYDHGNYNEAYNYALKTNAINNSMEESWLIFAKSLIKMGKIDQAKKTLQMYLNQSNSENAKRLLDSINTENSK